MKILVTGANGYIGSKVVKELLNMGHYVIAVDKNDNHIDKRAKVILCDIFMDIDYYSFFEHPDVCLHLAWRNGFEHNSPTHMLDLSSHFAFLKKMIDSGIKQIAVMGTMHELGYFEGKVEDVSYTNPLSLYGISKDSLRRSLKLYCMDKTVVFQWLRAFYIYGNDDFGNSIFCKIKAAAQKGERKFPFTSGKNKYDFIHINELSKKIACAVSQSEISGEINVCSGNAISLSEQIESYICKNNLSIKLDYGKFPDRPYDSPCIYGDCSKIDSIMKKHK
ncbi:MAG: NAD(P)-dependent oxidoreductase [Clostridia bacterium]|nr:NAD(P)-dependent oxidoreductase [Clostridia bacterium]